MRCRTVQPQLLDFSGGRLDPRLRQGVEAHLQACAACRRVLKQETQTASLLGSLERLAPRADAWLAVGGALQSSTTRRPAYRRPPQLWLGSMAAAAALAAALFLSPGRAPMAPPESESLWALRPSAAAGLAADRTRDPLLSVQAQMDLFLDELAEQGS